MLQHRLGQGGMAEVWKAFDQRLERPVAIKFLHATLRNDPTFVSRFQREARAVASLRHPNIVQIYDFETANPEHEETQAYMVMDYIEGSTLADFLLTTAYAKQFLAPDELVQLMFSISEALDYAHERGLLHRDIKPANILLDQRRTSRNSMGEPILSDFGIAKIIGSNDGTLTSSVVGTPYYISPEQARGQACTAASDLYSLGVVLYEICTGTRPFGGDTPLAILQEHIMLPPTPPEQFNPGISSALSLVIMRSLAKNPAERFQTAGELTAALADALGVALPEKQRRPLSSPDIRGLPASSDQLAELPTHLLADIQPNVRAARTPLAAPNTPTALATPVSPVLQTADTLYPASTSLSTPPKQPARAAVGLATTPPPVHVPQKRSPNKPLLLVLSCLGILLILGSGFLTFLALHARGQTTTQAGEATMTQLVGHAFFTSSGAAPGTENLGLNDTFQVQLTGVPQPTAGTQYYAWLLPDQIQSEESPRAVGVLSVTNGMATLPEAYVDPQHANLLAQFSRFLVTEEPTNPAPQSPALDTKQWRYYAEIPQNPPAMNCQGVINQLSALCHLRHLLSGDPELTQVNLAGGLNFWFLNNIEEVAKWAREGVDHSGADDVRHKMVDILYMLDGRGCIAQDIQEHGAVGETNTPDDATLSTEAAIPLLDCAWTPTVTSYVAHIHNHLNAMIQSPGVLSDQVALANQIAPELNAINAWLLTIQSDARQLIGMKDAQVIQTQGIDLRNEIAALATNVLSGGTNSQTGMQEPGVQEISNQIQQLATMDVMLYTAH